MKDKLFSGGKISLGVMCVILLFLAVAGLTERAAAEDFTIVTTFTILEDFAAEVAGPDGDVRVISPVGAEVHEWELKPGNFVDIEEADVILYNGLNVEQWMRQVKAVAGETPVIPVGEECDYPELPIITGEYAGETDPHIWMDPGGAISYVELIRDKLIEHNPERADEYRRNAQEYIEKLESLHERLKESFSVIPEQNRVLLTTEAAFIYFAEAYRFEHDGVWGTNTEQEGTPGQMKRIMEIVEERAPGGIFWESTGSDRYVRSISADTGVPVYGPLYVDSVAKSGSDADDYIGMMETNVELLREVLGP